MKALSWAWLALVFGGLFTLAASGPIYMVKAFLGMVALAVGVTVTIAALVRVSE